MNSNVSIGPCKDLLEYLLKEENRKNILKIERCQKTQLRLDLALQKPRSVVLTKIFAI